MFVLLFTAIEGALVQLLGPNAVRLAVGPVCVPPTYLLSSASLGCGSSTNTATQVQLLPRVKFMLEPLTGALGVPLVTL
jgi:hypothetical protein